MIDDHPIPLSIAAKELGIGVRVLRAEAAGGRLAIYRLGSRYYTTRNDLRAMVKACRVVLKAPGSISTEDERPGLSETDRISSARAALKATLSARGRH